MTGKGAASSLGLGSWAVGLVAGRTARAGGVMANTGEVPSWARAILFWRKVLAVERRGIPAQSMARS